MTISIDDSNHSNGSIALRNYLNDLFLEKTGSSIMSDDDCEDDGDVSLSSDEESLVGNHEEIDEDENDSFERKTNDSISKKKSSSSNELNVNTNHTRRHRFRRSRNRQAQRPMFAVTTDNARGVRGGKQDIGGELRVSSYHNKIGSTSTTGTPLPTSASAHTYSSLGSRTGISNSSVNKWRTIQQKARSAMMSRSEHRDSRWSTTGDGIPRGSLRDGVLKGSQGKHINSSRIKSYDFGFVNDSIHRSTTLRKNYNGRGSSSRTLLKSNMDSRKKYESYSTRKVIDSAVRVASDYSDSSSDSEGEEFYEDNDGSISSFTMDTFDESKNSNTSSVVSNLDFGNNYKIKSKAMELPSCRVAPARTVSVGDIPRLPRRTMDDSFEGNNSSVSSETFEPLKGGSIVRFPSPGEFQRTKVLRSKSSDSFMTKSISPSESENSERRGSDVFGRWGACTSSRSKDTDSSLKCPAPPRRIPSTSMSNRSTGRNSNHSNDSSEPSDSDTETTYDFDNSFARCIDLDDSLNATVATNEACKKDTKSHNESLKLLLPAYSAHHPSRALKMAIPESLRKLPHHSYHGSPNFSSKSLKYPGKSLHSISRKWR